MPNFSPTKTERGLISVDHPQDRPNFCVVTLGQFQFWFSYSSIVAFRTPSGRVVSQNRWSKTTGKHLNLIDHGLKSDRVPAAEFQQKLALLMEHIHDAIEFLGGPTYKQVDNVIERLIKTEKQLEGEHG